MPYARLVMASRNAQAQATQQLRRRDLWQAKTCTDRSFPHPGTLALQRLRPPKYRAVATVDSRQNCVHSIGPHRQTRIHPGCVWGCLRRVEHILALGQMRVFMTRRSATLSAAAAFVLWITTDNQIQAQQQGVPHGDSTHVSDWLNALPVSRAALAEYHRRKEAGLLPVAAKSTSEVGDTLTFKVWNFRESRNERVVLDDIDFRLELKSDDVLLWVELEELDRGRFSKGAVQHLYRVLAEKTPYASIDPDRGIMANSESLFGEPPDVNGDGTVDVLLLRIRDDNSIFGSSASGFVWSGDLSELGNNRDIVYIDTEDNPGRIVAHEYQHLIHFNYDLREFLFVNEGLSRLSEIANGYAPDDGPALDRPNQYDAPLLRFGTELRQNIRYLRADYLRAGLFTTYMAERIGYEAVGALARDSDRRGVDSYVAVLDQHNIALEDLVLEFHAANVLNRVDLHERYGYRTGAYKHIRARTSYEFDGRIQAETPPIEVNVKEGAPSYFVWRHVPNLSVAVVPDAVPSSLRGLALLERNGQLEVAPLTIGPHASVFEGTYDRVTAVVAHVHPTNTGQGLERFVLTSSWEDSGVTGSFSRDLKALEILYDSTNGRSWANREGWSFSVVPTPQEVAAWHGVAVESGRVSSLDLTGNRLLGEIPHEVGGLSALKFLRLVSNQLRGAIPGAVGNLVQLQFLGLSNNSLGGRIPDELAELKELEYLLLDGNRLTGRIPSALGSLERLRDLNLRDNALTGEIPGELASLASLDWLQLGENQLTGRIPGELGNASRLESLLLYRNQLSGPIPGELGRLFRLRVLWLDYNDLAGSIPREVGDLSELRFMNLSSNDLTGEIPPELGNLLQLERLYLYGNKLTGSVPQELGNLAKLEHLSLADNALSGPLPESLMNLRNLELFNFEGQHLCAPADDAFRAWLRTIPRIAGPYCTAVQFQGNVEDQAFTVEQPVASLSLPEASGGVSTLFYALEPALPAGLAFDEAARTIRGTPTAITPAASYTYSATDNAGSIASLTFTIEVVAPVGFSDAIADQSFPRAQPIAPHIFPEAAGGAPPIEYQLRPSLPAGLVFDAATRSLTGTPAVVTSGALPYTYSATGANGSSDSLQFTLEVYSPVAVEHESLPESFVVHGNYPNPFRQSTHLVFDLPWPASVTVEVVDLTGRRVLALPGTNVGPGWGRTIRLDGAAISSGMYIYRLRATSADGGSLHTGGFVRIR